MSRYLLKILKSWNFFWFRTLFVVFVKKLIVETFTKPALLGHRVSLPVHFLVEINRWMHYNGSLYRTYLKENLVKLHLKTLPFWSHGFGGTPLSSCHRRWGWWLVADLERSITYQELAVEKYSLNFLQNPSCIKCNDERERLPRNSFPSTYLHEFYNDLLSNQKRERDH